MIFVSEQAGFSTNKIRTVSIDRSVSGINIECDSVITGMMANIVCRATYSDGAKGLVRPEWTITTGGTYASIDANGHLTINTNANASTVVIAASYKDKTDIKTILVTYKFDFELAIDTSDTAHYCQGWGSIQHDTGLLAAVYNNSLYTVIIPSKSGAKFSISSQTLTVDGTTYYPCIRVVGKQEQSYNTETATEWTYAGASGTVTCNGARMKNAGYYRCSIYDGWGIPTTSQLDTVPYAWDASFENQNVNVEWVAISLGFSTSPTHASGASWLASLDEYANLINVTYHIYDE